MIAKRKWFQSAFVATVLAASASAWAQSAPVGTGAGAHRDFMDYDGSFRTMGQTDAESDSDCIGDMRTLLCAFETYIAAAERRDPSLRMIAIGEDNPKNRKPFTPVFGFKTGYRVLSIRLFSLIDVPGPDHNPYDIQPWDVAIYYDTCNVTYGPCEDLFGETASQSSVLFRRGGYGWHMVPGQGWRIDLTDPAIYNRRPPE